MIRSSTEPMREAGEANDGVHEAAAAVAAAETRADALAPWVPGANAAAASTTDSDSEWAAAAAVHSTHLKQTHKHSTLQQTTTTILVSTY